MFFLKRSDCQQTESHADSTAGKSQKDELEELGKPICRKPKADELVRAGQVIHVFDKRLVV